METAQSHNSAWLYADTDESSNLADAGRVVNLQSYRTTIAHLNVSADGNSDRQDFLDIDDALVSAQIRQLQQYLNEARFNEAEIQAREIVTRFPNQGFARHVLGALHLKQGQILEALLQLETATQLMPDNAEAHNNLGCALERHGRLPESEISYRRALKFKPQFALAHHNLGVVLRQLGRLKESEICLRTAIAIVPDYTDAYFNLGLVLAKLNQSSEAEKNFHLVLKQKPDHTHALIALGNVAANMGQFAQAERYYQQVLAVKPDNLAAWSAIPEIRKMTCTDLDWLRTSIPVLRGCLHPRELSRYYFSMAKYFDDIKDPNQAFHHYRRANELSKLIAAPYQAQRETDITNRICATFKKPRLTCVQTQASRSGRPVFVVGMPRSGTSLVEQIVASHPLVIGAGELDFWTRAMRHTMPAAPNDYIDPASVKYLGNAYLKLLNEITRDAVRVVDKAPQNFRNLGLINTVFPHAKIIHLQRNPIDTCLSIYCQDFSSAFSYANDLTNLAHYYREYQRMMAHWSATIPASQLLQVPYDALVNDQEGWTRKIIDFMGLEWDQRCMNFQTTVRRVETASQWQVRQGMYKTSIQRWKKYEQYLGPLLDLTS